MSWFGVFYASGYWLDLVGENCGVGSLKQWYKYQILYLLWFVRTHKFGMIEGKKYITSTLQFKFAMDLIVQFGIFINFGQNLTGYYLEYLKFDLSIIIFLVLAFDHFKLINQFVMIIILRPTQLVIYYINSAILHFLSTTIHNLIITNFQ